MKAYCVFETKRGFVALAGSEGTLSQTTLARATRAEALAALREGPAADWVEDETAFGSLPERFRRYYAGERVDFSDVQLDVSGFGPFHKAVLAAARQVPYGALVTYGDLARMAGSDRACRAAGAAMALNRAPIVVPCHRVVASGGKIGGFGPGLEWKRSLLRLEGVDI